MASEEGPGDAVVVDLSEDDDEDSADDSSSEENDQQTTTTKGPCIRIDRTAIECVSLDDEDELGALGVTVYDQGRYEEGVMRQIEKALDNQDTTAGKASTSTVSTTPKNILRDFSSEPPIIEKTTGPRKRKYERDSDAEDEWRPESGSSSEDEYIDQDDDEFIPSDEEQNRKKTKSKSKKTASLPTRRKKLVEFKGEDEDDTEDKVKLKSSRQLKQKDDGDEKYFKKRMKALKEERLREEQDYGIDSWSEMEEVDDDFLVPAKIWEKLFPHQQSCVKWLWALHNSCVGGIIGDEMGLGKTISIIAFLAGLHFSKLDRMRESFQKLGPILLICPATVMHNWLFELHSWFPLLRVIILHASGSSTSHRKPKKLLQSIHGTATVVISTYASLNEYQDILVPLEWHYVILDEGHKIRNPDAQTTLAAKRMRTPHRLILSGSPIQNNLKELWSLMDFCVPGLLGPLPVFQESFAVPITRGGYSNASDVEVKIGYRVACVLRDTIKPYLLRRTKQDVKDDISLPSKNEQVLFCRLTPDQRNLYQKYVDSPAVREIVKGSNDMFVGLINLRKLCNHPFLFHRSRILKGQLNNSKSDPSQSRDKKVTSVEDFNEDGFHIEATDEFFFQSGKMSVLNSLLRLWKQQGHRVLLFSQGVQMLTILEKYLNYKDYTHLVLDGRTPISQRQGLVNKFNEDCDVFIFLLTTRVGGIGVNLTGASRVILFDPDWNPSTDSQARERAWRIGQDKSVTVYRLLTAGTVEEKMYQRQVFKQYLSIRILKDPRQRRFFQTSDLYDLFTLGSEDGETRSQAIFAGTGSEVKVEEKAKKKKRKKGKKSKKSKNVDNSDVVLPPEKIEELRERAKQLSRMLAEKFGKNEACNSNEKSDAPNSTSKKSKTKKKKSSDLIGGTQIDALVRHETYRTSEENSNQSEHVSRKQDDYVLSQLFGKQKDNIVHALQHDVIEGTVADYTLIEADAEKVANDALEAVRRSRSNCFSATSGVPTWTGASGKLKAVKNRPSFGKVADSTDASSTTSSSKDLLKAMRSRHRLDGSSTNSNSTSEQSSFAASLEVDSIHSELLTDLRAFIAFQAKKPGEVTTDEVVSHFKDRVLPHQNPIFKSFLRKLCDFSKKNGVGIWSLKSEFK